MNAKQMTKRVCLIYLCTTNSIFTMQLSDIQKKLSVQAQFISIKDQRNNKERPNSFIIHIPNQSSILIQEVRILSEKKFTYQRPIQQISLPKQFNWHKQATNLFNAFENIFNNQELTNEEQQNKCKEKLIQSVTDYGPASYDDSSDDEEATPNSMIDLESSLPHESLNY